VIFINIVTVYSKDIGDCSYNIYVYSVYGRQYMERKKHPLEKKRFKDKTSNRS
jgi:hypothetical protein